MARRATNPWILSCALCAVACGPNLSRDVAPDCNAGADDEFPTIFLDSSKLSPGAAPSGFDFGDTTPNSQLSWGAVDVDGSQTCGRTRVLDMLSVRHNDYGSSFFFVLAGFGATSGINVSNAAGISFWARSPQAESDKSVTLFLTDDTTDTLAGICTQPTAVDVVQNGVDNVTTTQNGTNASQTPGFAYRPTDCGNDFQYVIHFTTEWTLYRIPFGEFYQLQQVNIEPNGLDTSNLWEFYFRIPKEAHFELWLDQLGVYQPSSASAGP